MNVVRTVIRNPGIVTTILGVPGADGTGGGGGGSGTVTSVTLTQPAAGITITNSGVAITTSGARTFALANDLAALEALSGTNTIYYRSASDTWSAVTIGSSLSFSGGTLNLGTTPALGTPASGDFSTGTFTWPTFNQNTTGTAAVASAVTTANEASDTTCFVAFVNASGSANQAVKVNTGFTFNASTGAVGMTSLVLGGTLSATGYSITKAGAATFDSLSVTGSNAATFGLYTITLGGNSTIDQDVSTTASPTFNDLTVSGNLTVNGTTTTFNTATVEVEDSLMELAVGNTANSLDSGWYANYQTAATPLYLGFFWDASALKFRCFTGLQSEPTTTVNIAGTGYTTGTLVANTEGTHDGVIGGTTPAAGTFTTLVAGSTTSLLLGTAGSAVGNIGFRNATSGTATLAPPTGALGTYTVTLPNAASTLPIFGQQITFSGPTAARTITLPDANFTVARTDAANTFTGASTITSWNVTTDIRPSSNDGAALGVSGTAFSDIFLASGAVVNFAAGNATITHSSGLLTFNVPISLGTSNAATVGTIELGHASDTTLSRSAAGVLAVEGVDAGTMDIVQSSKSADYTLALTDRSKCIYHPSSDANARTFTIPANASVAFGIGSTISFINDSANSCTIAITSDTLVWTPTGGTGSRTLAQYGVATITKVTSTRWYISGSGLS